MWRDGPRFVVGGWLLGGMSGKRGEEDPWDVGDSLHHSSCRTTLKRLHLRLHLGLCFVLRKESLCDALVMKDSITV